MMLCRRWLLLAVVPACLAPLWAGEPFTVQVDPPDRLVKATVWQPVVEAKELAKGPDLDLGYNDYLQLRLRLPKAAVPLSIDYGTSVAPGLEPARRRISLPAAKLIWDGAWHTYRLDLGLEVPWRDTLRDLRLNLPAGAEAEYVEVGDVPGDELAVNTDLNIFVGVDKWPKETMADTQHSESKHCTFWWSKQSYNEFRNFDPQVMGRRAQRMVEECYQVYCKLRGYAEPFVCGDAAKRDGKRYKVNVTTWYGGFWMGGQNGFGYLNIGGGGLLDEGWGNPMPHEFGHVVQGAQPGFLTGSYWESHANYLRSLRNSLYSDLFPGHVSDVGRGMLDLSCFQQDQFRLIYADFRIYNVLDDYAVDYGLPADIVARLWRDGDKEQVVWKKLASVLPAGRSIKDVAGEALRYWVTLDLKAGDKMKAQLRPNPREAAYMDQATGADLEPLAAEAGWYRVAWGRAPMRYGYMFSELAPARDGATVTAELRGLDLPGAGEDWRWSLVAQKGEGKPRYSPVFRPGLGSLKLNPGEDRVYLVVVATPDQLDGSQHGLQHEHPLDRDPSFRRYPYEVRLTGAVPRPRAAQWPLPAGHKHPNGGGFVADTAKVADTAYVGPNARVLDAAQVLGRARIDDYALVADRAVVDEDAQVSGCAVVRDGSQVKGHARIRDHAKLRSDCRVAGDVLVQDSADLDRVQARDQAVFRGCTQPWNAEVSGHAILEYDYSMDFKLADGVHYNHVPWGGWWNEYWCQVQRKPRGLTASYRFDEPDGQVALDEFGSLNATLRGVPARVTDAGHGSVVTLNGRNQWIELDDSVVDATALTIGLWCKPGAGPADQPLLHLAGASDRALTLTPADARGLPSLSLALGKQSVAISGARRLPAGQWAHLAAVLAPDKVTLYVDGQPSSAALPAAVDLRAAYGRPQANFVGRGGNGRLFAGQVADVRCYNVALTDAELGAEMARTGALMGAFLPAAKTFDGQATTADSGLRNGATRTLSAWIKPTAVDGTRPVFCSRDERDGARQGGGLSIEGGRFRARLDGRGWWDTGVAALPGEWQQVALAFDGKSARLYVGGKEVAQTAYEAKNLSPKPYRLGYSQESEDKNSRRFFVGELRDMRVFSRALSATEVAALAK
ncbi:MAG: hypothetical protein HZB16_07050 [Armatimonadetes bacterium]|nr:hypothetical protein [Armatimonadota bacterium]